MSIDPSSGESGVTAPYTYVPTAASAATSAWVRIVVSPSGVSSEAQGQQVLQGWVEWGQAHGGSASSIMLGGHPSVLWWDHEAPARPGCLSCPLDPGPDSVTIGLAAYLGNTPGFGGLTMVDVQGSARIDAVPLDIFCDMEAMSLGVTFSQ
jgi:hypothetical protein